MSPINFDADDVAATQGCPDERQAGDFDLIAGAHGHASLDKIIFQPELAGGPIDLPGALP
jgi:hypothetical protein